MKCAWRLVGTRSTAAGRWRATYQCGACGNQMMIYEPHKFARSAADLDERARGVNCIAEMAMAELLDLPRQ